MKNSTVTCASLLVALGLTLCGCGETGGDATSGTGASGGGDSHTHADGSTNDDHADDHVDGHADDHADHDDHDHDYEVALDPATIGDMTLELAQGHGAVEAGKESHLVVKLPYNDDGATVVRAWIGTADRTLSFVGKGEYAPSHDNYDIHAMVPDPLPENTMWWIEIEKPDGTKVVGSARPIVE